MRADKGTAHPGAKLELNGGGCTVHGFAACPIISMVKICWLTLNLYFGVGAWAPTELNIAPPLGAYEIYGGKCKRGHEFNRLIFASSFVNIFPKQKTYTPQGSQELMK